MTPLDLLLQSHPNLTLLTLGDLKLSLNDLAERRAEDTNRIKAGHLYMPILEVLRAELNAMPESLISGLPLADALAEADATHDDFGSALWFLAQACKRLPSLSDETLAVILQAQETFIPERGILRRSYAQEAAEAISHRPALEAQRPALSKIPTPDGRTLADLVDDFLGAGEQIEALLSERAQESEGGTRAHIASLRGRIVSTLGNFRSSHIDEIRAGFSPVASFDAVWSYVHQLAASRARNMPKPTP